MVPRSDRVSLCAPSISARLSACKPSSSSGISSAISANIGAQFAEVRGHSSRSRTDANAARRPGWATEPEHSARQSDDANSANSARVSICARGTARTPQHGPAAAISRDHPRSPATNPRTPATNPDLPRSRPISRDLAPARALSSMRAGRGGKERGRAWASRGCVRTIRRRNRARASTRPHCTCIVRAFMTRGTVHRDRVITFGFLGFGRRRGGTDVLKSASSAAAALSAPARAAPNASRSRASSCSVGASRAFSFAARHA